MSAPWRAGEPKKIVIVGLGLIGGSLAKALTQNTPHQVLGMDIDDDSLLDACSCGAIRGKAGPEDLKDAETKIAYLENLKRIAAGCTDAESFKAEVGRQYPQYSGQNYLDMTAGFFFA